MPNPIVHFEVIGTDGSRLQEFYSVLFGWTISADNPMNYALASTKDGDLGIDGAITGAQGDDGFRGVRLFAQVDDVDAYLERVTELGGSVVMPASDLPEAGIREGMFKDPEGNYFGVVQSL